MATDVFGKTAQLTFMPPLARVMFWVSVAAWVLVAAAFLARPALRFVPRRRAQYGGHP